MLDCATFPLSPSADLSPLRARAHPNATVVLGDDHPVYLLGLTAVMRECDLRVVAQTASGCAALEACKAAQPDVLFFDARMLENSALLPDIRKWCKSTRIAILIDAEAAGNLALWSKVEVDAILSKSADPTVICAAVEALLDGCRFVDPEVQAVIDHDRHLADQTQQLTTREKQVLMLVVEGKSNRDVAETLGISIKTVDNHRTRMMAKLKVNSLAQLITRTLKEGLLERL